MEGVQDKYQGLEASEVVSVVHSLERQLVREMTLTTKERIDGRGSADVRPIHSEIGLLPRTHGSAPVHSWGDTSISCNFSRGGKGFTDY